MGTGIVYTKAEVDTLISDIPSGGGGTGLTTFGTAALSSFTGSTDDAKLTAALSYAGAQTHIPAIIFDYSPTFTQTGRTPFTGMKLYGPISGANGQMNLEISSGKPVNHRVLLSGMGTGTSSWFYGTSTYYDIHVVGLAFQAASGGQFWHQPSGTIYACTFNDLTMYGFTSCFGNATSACLITACYFGGMWEVLGWSATAPQFHFGGSDSNLWMHGQLNLQSGGGSGGGMPAMWLDSQQKTNCGYIYITCQNGFGGLRISNASDLKFFGGTYEGMNASAPSTIPVVDMQGGVAKFFGTDFNYTTTANGTITQSGGNLDLYSPTYWRASSVDNTFPLLYQTGGTAGITFPNCRQSGENCTVRWSDGTIQSLVRANKTVIL